MSFRRLFDMGFSAFLYKTSKTLIVDCSLCSSQSQVRLRTLTSCRPRLMVYYVSDDLNSLYVYEAKMSLFIRIAQTRQGAERLIESRVLPILADCDFLDALPEVDQSFIGVPPSKSSVFALR